MNQEQLHSLKESVALSTMTVTLVNARMMADDVS
jgi:hypothetical protein